MKDISHWNRFLRKALFVSIGTILYSGPAAAFTLDRFLGETFADETSSAASEMIPFVVVVWIAAIPLIQGVRYWDKNPDASIAWFGFFLVVIALALPRLIGFRGASMLVILPALAFPFQWIELPSSMLGVGVIIARIVTYTLFFAVPLGGIVVQLLQRRSVRYERL